GLPCTAKVTRSWRNVIPTSVSPLATALAGAAPDLVYWLTLRCRRFRYSKPLSSPCSCTIVASRVYEVPELFGSATCTSSRYFSDRRSLQHLGSGSFLRASSSLL